MEEIMGKIILLISSLFLNFIQDNFQYQEELVTSEIVEEVENYQVVVNKTKKLMYGKEIVYEFSNDCAIKLIKTNNALIVATITNGQLNFKMFDNFNRLINDVSLPGIFNTQFDVAIYKDKIIFAGGITKYDKIYNKYKKDYFQETDAFLCLLNQNFEVENVNIYGGKLDEVFNRIIIANDDIYLTGFKETLSGGDFGNGGGSDYGYLYVKLDASLALESYGTTKEKIYDMYIYDNDVYLLGEENIYHLNNFLVYDYSIPLDSKITFGILTYHKLAVTISDSIKIYDLNTQKVIKEIDISPYQDVKVVNGKFIFKINDEYKAITIYDLRNFICEAMYDGNKINQTINNLFTIIPLTNTIYYPSFNPLVYGRYDVDYYYDDFKVSGIIHVPFEANVSEGFIYPLGYRLLFTGNGYLDGELIVNNHAVQKSGNHQLKLYGCDGEEKIINFKIDKDQIPFSEYQDKSWNLEAYPNQDFEIVIHHPYSEYQVTNIIINNFEYRNYQINPQELIIKLQENEPGIYDYHLQEITFMVNNEKITKNINYYFKVNVLKNSLEVEGKITDDTKHLYYDAIVADPDAEIRGINVKVTGGSEEQYYHFPICDRDLLLTGLEVHKNYQCEINLTINEGDGILKDFTLLSFALTPNEENMRIGEVNIIQKGLTLEKFKLILKKHSSISKLYLDNKLIYEYQEPDDTKVIVSSFISGVIIFVIIYYYRKRKHRFSLKDISK